MSSMDRNGNHRLPLARLVGEGVEAAGRRTVPQKPTQEMLLAGTAAGGVSTEVAHRVWQAMIDAADA